MTLRDLKVGQSARIKAVGGEGELRQHFLDMGVIPGAELTLVKLAPMGDPMEFQIHGYELTLRLADAVSYAAPFYFYHIFYIQHTISPRSASIS